MPQGLCQCWPCLALGWTWQLLAIGMFESGPYCRDPKCITTCGHTGPKKKKKKRTLFWHTNKTCLYVFLFFVYSKCPSVNVGPVCSLQPGPREKKSPFTKKKLMYAVQISKMILLQKSDLKLQKSSHYKNCCDDFCDVIIFVMWCKCDDFCNVIIFVIWLFLWCGLFF